MACWFIEMVSLAALDLYTLIIMLNYCMYFLLGSTVGVNPGWGVMRGGYV